MSRFASMGCDVVVEGASPAEAGRIRELFEDRDAVFSRFRPDSELNRVHAAGGAMLASPLFARMVEAALWARDTTGGLVDPTLGAALEAAGYDRDFHSLDAAGTAPATPQPHGSVALYGRVLLLGRGTKLDLNGVVKAAAVDDALGLLSGPGFVSAGGDLATRGSVDIALPGGGGRAARLRRPRDERPHQAALAPHDEEQHHLIDPATGRPSTSRWDEVTVCGATCLAADVAAKAAFLLGDDGPDWLEERGLPGRFLAGGLVHENRRWRESVEPRELACT